MRLFEPSFADGFVGMRPFRVFNAAAEGIGGDEVGQVLPELIVRVVVVAFDGCVLDGAVHPFDLPVRPGMAWLGEPMIDVVLRAGERERNDSGTARRRRSPA